MIRLPEVLDISQIPVLISSHNRRTISPSTMMKIHFRCLHQNYERREILAAPYTGPPGVVADTILDFRMRKCSYKTDCQG